jgi:hypothetical protein
MKKIIFLLLAVTVSVLFSCKQNEKHEEDVDAHMNHDTTMMHNEDKMMDEASVYVCPMHPDVHGTMNDKCSECGMTLELKKK